MESYSPSLALKGLFLLGLYSTQPRSPIVVGSMPKTQCHENLT